MDDLEELKQKAKTFPSLLDLTDKKALIVGGNKGLGQAMALALAAAGADVCVSGRGPVGLDETAEAVISFGRKGMSVAADATDEKNVENLIRRTVDGLGGLDILVNSQGIGYLHPSVDYDMAEWERVINVNLKSLVLTCKHAARIMLAKGKGKIINISSVRGFQGRIGDMAYAPSKGAVNQLTRSLAIEWGPKGINVNAIAPAFIWTEISAPVLSDPEKRNWVISRVPLGRLGQREDIFGPVLFLASDVSSFVNGHVLMLDGGWLIA
ncbi:MAG: glucose 1-dehydrogenase [Planctomycetes bacterium]|nr:glucose 1-dehydrogenase [Planctomycetota bacterium]